MSKLDEIKQALEAATKLFPAPWERDEYINQIYCAKDRGAVVADPRGWGHLTGFLGLDPDTAVEAQKANARLIVEAVNNLPALLKVAEAAEACDFFDDFPSHANLRKALEELNND